MASKLDAALDLMRRLPPQNTQENLSNIIELAPELTDDLLAAIDQPLRVERDSLTNRDFLLCDYNRDGDSYRSPWSNKYFPDISEGMLPSDEIRKLEIQANDAFDTYRELYYEQGSISSVYMWDLESEKNKSFAACVLFKKEHATSGSWDSIHVLEVVVRSNLSALYKLTSTILLDMATSLKQEHTAMRLAGHLTRQMEQQMPLDQENNTHIMNMGRIVEEMEIKMRSSLQEIYFGKTRNILNDLRTLKSTSVQNRQIDIQKELAAKLRNVE